MKWISVNDQLPNDQQVVLAFVPDNHVPTPGNPYETEHKPIKILRFIKNFYGRHKQRHKNSQSDDFWSGEGLTNHFFQEVTHWLPLPEAPAK
jgi:hypothetical protein